MKIAIKTRKGKKERKRKEREREKKFLIFICLPITEL